MFTGAMFDGQKLRLTSPAYPCGYPCGYVAATGQSSGGATRYVAATGWLCARVGGARSWRARSGEVSLTQNPGDASPGGGSGARSPRVQEWLACPSSPDPSPPRRVLRSSLFPLRARSRAPPPKPSSSGS